MIVFVLIPVIFSGCANIVAPTGGPEDTQAPRLDTAASTPNMQTNFKKQDIILAFDEWLKLQDVFNQVVVSPPLDYQPEVRLKKKSVIFEFDEREELREGATYVINFGTAIKDLTANNEVPNMRFVFSTGDYIDSLQVKGSVIDAQNGKGVADVLVMLYDNLADSVVRSVKPFYFARTDKQGAFEINNVKADTFKVFALTGLDYFYNNSKESIGFLESPILVTDSFSTPLNIKLFTEEQPLKFVKADDKQYGLLKLIFNAKASDVAVTHAPISPPPIIDYAADTIKLWYTFEDRSAWEVYVKVDTSVTDTIMVKERGKASFLEKAKLRPLGRGTSRKNIKPGEPIQLQFNHPLTSIDTANIQLLEDTLQTIVRPDLQIDSTNKRLLQIHYKWQAELPYQLNLLPAALTDFYGFTNDSIQLDYLAATKAQYGDLRIKLIELDSSLDYTVQLHTKNEKLLDEQQFSATSVFQKEYKTLPPGTYQITIIEDINGNGRWDSGNYDQKRQPERLLIKQLEELRADWEVEAEINVASELK